ncbi:MAG: hypothetical protein P1U70_11975, partial [Saprospiraceae bacterium]|nr:hypothetical protein [Saprospiraceae bacterium]
IYSINAFILVMYLRFTVKDVLGLYILGLFSIAQQTGMIMENCELIVSTRIWRPIAFKLLSNDEIYIFFKKSLIPVAFLFVLMCLLCAFNYFAFKWFIAKTYYAAFYSSIVILFAFFIKSLYGVYVSYLLFFENTKLLACINCMIGFLSLFLSHYLLNKFSLIGAAYTMLINYILLFVLVFGSVAYSALKAVRRTNNLDALNIVNFGG